MLFKLFKAITVMTIVFKSSDAKKILCVFPMASFSHQITFRPLTHALAERGHEVTVITTDPAFPKGGAPKNLREIDVHDVSYNLWRDRLGTFSTGNKNDQEKMTLGLFSDLLEAELQVPEVQQLINNKNETFDLLILELCVLPALGFSHLYKAPVIWISSFGGIPHVYKLVGAPIHPIIYSTIMTQKIHNKTVWDKMVDILTFFYVTYMYYDLERSKNVMMKKYFGNDTPTMAELSKNVQMLFLNVHPIWEDNRPVPPNVIYLGGIHQKSPKDLPLDLKSYLDSSKHGVIYFSLGTNVLLSSLPPERIQIILNVFSKLPFDILWKWDKDGTPDTPKNVRIEKWLPQPDLLRHPNVKLFITQGGLQSIDEAITAAVPMIGIPMLADQWFNVERCVQFKICVQLELKDLTEKQLKNAIDTVTGDESYHRNIEKLRYMMNDQPQRPLERAIWWTEHILRHGGAEHLESAAANMPWMQYYEISVVLTIISSGVFLVYIFWKCLRIITTPNKSQWNLGTNVQSVAEVAKQPRCSYSTTHSE